MAATGEVGLEPDGLAIGATASSGVARALQGVAEAVGLEAVSGLSRIASRIFGDRPRRAFPAIAGHGRGC